MNIYVSGCLVFHMVVHRNTAQFFAAQQITIYYKADI
jgi:hypothetical protein